MPNAFLKFNFFSVLVKEFILGKMAVGVFQKFGFLPEFFVPKTHLGFPWPALGKVCVHYRMDNQG